MIDRIEPPGRGRPPFSGAVAAGCFIFVSGQVGLDPRTGTPVSNEVREQTRAALENIESKLHKAGCGRADVAKTTVFLRNMEDFQAMNEEYRMFFDPDFPARSTVEARLARPDLLVEIEAIAFRKDRRVPASRSRRPRVRLYP